MDLAKEQEERAAAQRRRGLQHPPLNWVALLARDDNSDWMAVHRFHAQEVWHGARGIRAKTGLIFRTLVWPLRAAGLALRHTAKVGGFVKKRTSKGRWRQFREQLQLAVFECISPKSYYTFALYEPANRDMAQRFIHRYETKSPARIYSAISSDPKAGRDRLWDKAAFHDHCVANGLPTPRIHLIVEDGKPQERPGMGYLPAHDLFVKPLRSRGGKHVQAWDHSPVGDYRNINGDRFDRPNLVTRLQYASEGRGLLVQDRLRNHPEIADFCGVPLATARIMTVLNEAGRPEPVAAVFRMGVGDALVDNVHRGGIAACVDLKTGELGRALGIGLKTLPREVHPKTGRAFCGERLPDWDQALRLAVRAHEAFEGRTVVGWDIGFTEDGPMLVEGNSAPGVHMLQRGNGEPIGGTRFGQLLGYHLRRIEQRENAQPARLPQQPAPRQPDPRLRPNTSEGVASA